MPRLVKVAETDAIGDGSAAAFDVGGRRIAVFNAAGVFYALDDTCPHSGAPLSEGEVIRGGVRCPWHAACFDLKTGRVLSPPATEGVRSYKVVVAGNEIKVEI